MGKNLVTKAEYKVYAGISSPNHDAEIDLLIPKVSEFVKTYCKQTFVDYVDDPKVEHFSGGSSHLLLKDWPIIGVQGVETSTDYGRTWTKLAEFGDWALDYTAYGIHCVGNSAWPPRVNGYRVTYNAGYEELPGDLKLAVLDLITYYRRNDGAVHSTKAPGTNSVQIEYISTTTLPAHIRRVLDFYMADYI